MTDPRLQAMTLVAHRGSPRAYPENTLLGYQEAVSHGARHVETDVQCTADGVPVLYHDASTRRLSGVGGSVAHRTLEELDGLSACDPERFGDRFEGTPIPTLGAFAGWLAQHDAVTAFIEVKRVALKTHGIEPVMRCVMAALEDVAHRCVIISFDDRCVAHAAERYGVRTGWVLPRWNAEARARELAPDFLFASRSLFPRPPTEVWRGPWQWAVYVIDDLSQALPFVERGVPLIETDAIGDMLDQCRGAA